MSPSKKKYMRRKMAQAIGHQMKCAECVMEVHDYFVEFHPEWGLYFKAIGNCCFITIDFIKSLCIQAWGYFPDDMNKWLK